MSYSLPDGRTAIMGVLNVTPDSFSDGGLYLDSGLAVDRAIAMVREGADIVDVGGESTRPGADEVSEEEELRRVLPVVEALAREGITVSVDTSKAQIAKACLDAGARVVNDVTALRDPMMVEVCAREKCTVCLMHMKGDPRTMQANPVYRDVVSEVKEELLKSAWSAEAAGVSIDNIWLDPGIGFGKTVRHNLALLGRLEHLVATGYPVLIGVSRKSFLGKLIGGETTPAPIEERLEASLAAQVVAQLKGARVIRTHDVAATVRATKIADAILSQG